MIQKKRLIVLVDMEDGSECLINFAILASSFLDASIIFVHQISQVFPVLTEENIRKEIILSERKKALSRLKEITKERTFEKDQLIVEEGSLISILKGLESKYYNDWILAGLKQSNILKQILFGSKIVSVVENTDLITIAIPIDKELYMPKVLVVALKMKYGINKEMFDNLLSSFHNSIEKILLFTLIEENTDAQQESLFLTEIAQKYSAYPIDTLAISGNDFSREVDNIFKKYDRPFLVLQEGSRTFFDDVFRRFNTNQFIYKAHFPIIILPK